MTSWARPGIQNALVPRSMISMRRENHEAHSKASGGRAPCSWRVMYLKFRTKGKDEQGVYLCQLFTTTATQMWPGVGSLFPAFSDPPLCNVGCIISISRREKTQKMTLKLQSLEIEELGS